MDWREKIDRINKAKKEGVEVRVETFIFRLLPIAPEHGKRLREKAKELGVITVDHLNDEEIYDVMIETSVRGWKGFEEEGKEIPFSIEKAKEILLEKDGDGNLIFGDTLSKIGNIIAQEELLYREALIKN